MTVAVPLTNAAAEDLPKWTPQAKNRATRFLLRGLVILVILMWGLLLGYIFWRAPIKEMAASTLEMGASLTLVLAPVVAAAAAVERTLETIFDWVEGSWRTMVAYLGRGLRWLKTSECEVKKARQFLEAMSQKYDSEMAGIQLGEGTAADLAKAIELRIAGANALVALAQARLTKAEQELSSAPASDSYRAAKRVASIVLGLMLGVVVAAVGQLQMFALLGIGAVPARIDVLITGLVIGSGAYPVHTLIGILQQGKDTLDSVKGYYTRLERPKVETKAQQQVTAPASTPEGAPAVLQASVTTTTTTAPNTPEPPPA